jgi:hypothetical protein
MRIPKFLYYKVITNFVQAQTQLVSTVMEIALWDTQKLERFHQIDSPRGLAARGSD